MDSLEAKLEKVQDEHFEKIADERLTKFDQQFNNEAFEFRGAFRAVGHISRNLNSQLIDGLLKIEEKKYYTVWGYSNFAAYLNSDEVPEISKSTFYRLKPIYLAEGPERFDVYSGARIPIAVRKLLAENNVQFTLENNELVIGDKRVAVSDTAGIQELFDAFCHSIRERDVREEKLVKERDALKEKNDLGSKENEQLLRRIDSINESTPFERALMGAVKAMITLTSEVKALPDDERAERADADLKTMAEQWFQLRDAYGVKVPFSERPADGPSGDFEAKLAAAIAEPDDLDDEGDE